MKAFLIWAGPSAMAAIAVLACSSSSSNGGGSGGGAAASCFAQGNSACASCVENNCGSQLSAVESGCSDFIGCICPGGTFNASLAQGCLSKEQEQSCTSALSPMQSCESSHCQSQCSGGSSSSGGGSSGSSGGAPAGSVSCLTTIDGPQVCYVLQSNAVESMAQLMTQCTNAGTNSGLGGMIVAACPAANLVGCCSSASVQPSIECFYTGTQASNMGACNGAWMSGP